MAKPGFKPVISTAPSREHRPRVSGGFTEEVIPVPEPGLRGQEELLGTGWISVPGQ